MPTADLFPPLSCCLLFFSFKHFACLLLTYLMPNVSVVCLLFAFAGFFCTASLTLGSVQRQVKGMCVYTFFACIFSYVCCCLLMMFFVNVVVDDRVCVYCVTHVCVCSMIRVCV